MRITERKKRSSGVLAHLFLKLITCLPVILYLFISSCSSPRQSQLIIASIPPQEYFLERIAGRVFNIHTLLPAEANPKTYRLTAADYEKCRGAAIFFRTGLPYETRIITSLQEMNPGLKIVNCQQGIDTRFTDTFHRVVSSYLGRRILTYSEINPAGSNNKFYREPDPYTQVFDPYTWLSPALAKTYVENICQALQELIPARTPYFSNNLQTLQQELDSLGIYIQNRLNNLPNRKFLIYHPAWGYFADEFKLLQIPIEILGKSPGLKTINDIIHFSQQEKLKVIFIQDGFSRNEAEAIAEILRAKVITLQPFARDYPGNIINTADIMAEELQDQK